MMRKGVILAGRQATRAWVVCMVFGLIALVATAACGGSSQPSSKPFPTVIPLGGCEVCPVITNSSLAVGENRFSLGLLDEEVSPVLGAQVQLRFFDLNGDEPLLKSEGPAQFIPMELFFIDEQAGKERRFVGENGVYVSQVNFDVPGRWGVEVNVTLDDRRLDPLRFQFDVHEESAEPGIGDPAPASRQLTVADADISEIDSSFPLRPHMHDITITDALARGQPIVVAFATPAFCESRTCGPVMDTVMDPLYEKYKDQAIFIHVEPYKLKELREGIALAPVEALQEWNLQTEPWVFVIDKEGKIAGKFEGIVSMDEVESVLQRILEG